MEDNLERTNLEGTEVTEGQETSGAEKELSFDDLLKDKKYQSEFDKKISKALETAKAKWESDYTVKLEEAKTEAEKLAKMNAEQKAEYERKKLESELEQREKAITIRELKATAYETLADKSLPIELVEVLNFENAEVCNKSIEAVEKAFQKAVEKAVNDKLRGNKPPKDIKNDTSVIDKELRKAFGLK